MDYVIIIQGLWLILPAYVANASAVLVGGGKPIDSGRVWKDGRRVFGDGKTWRGLFSGVFMGMTVGFGLSVVAKYAAMNEEFMFLRLNDFEGFPWMIPLIFSLCFGALMGDIAESFLKRRVGKSRGEDWIPFDQFDFVLGALFCSFLMSTGLHVVNALPGNWFLQSFSPWHILVVLIFTPFFHLFSNFILRRSRT
jgi:CDP-2,3-bis-(O-geranylgeranyl)-sn-glycerol synthase